jgi:cytosine/adenosine deaminase-related metal-dependent hydrolase
MYLRADFVLPLVSPPIPHGAVRIEGHQIVAVDTAELLRPVPGEEQIDLGAAVLLPGLINSHCHLDYTGFRGSIDPQDSFTNWIKRINAIKRNFTPEDYLQHIAEGFQLSAESGVTTIANVEAFSELLPLLPVPPLRTWWFLELIDVRSRLNHDDTLMGALSFFDSHPDWLGGFGLSPHAPYTASVDLYRLAKMCGEKYGMICTTHIAESVEEQQMFSHASGNLYEFMASLGRDNSDCGYGSALSHLAEHGVLGNNCLLVHLNYLHDYDFELVGSLGSSVVHCPKCHTYFGHAAFPLRRLQEFGVNICLGTDSLASNNSLDLRSEMRHAVQLHGLKAKETVEMVTLNAALALSQKGKLGQLSPGALADLVAFPLADHLDDPYEQVLAAKGLPKLLMVNGKDALPR